ncbi:MAG: adenylosuccinate synthase [Myxococcales bacterium]|nr:adenylosuccinate synthase [Myxococcales bacterium]
MRGLVIVGAQWGDEGKGKVVDHYARRAQLVVRYQGGANAGHTLVVDGRKTVLHLVPSGVLYLGTACAVGPGCVVDPEALIGELDALVAAGVDIDPTRFLLSERAHLVLPVHAAVDRAREAAAGRDAIGTTGRGIGPAYEDVVARRGVRFADLGDPAHLRARLEALLFERNLLLKGLGGPTFEIEPLLASLAAVHARLAPFVRDVGRAVSEAAARGERVLFEGAQGTLLDVVHGSYPFVTSSATVAANAAIGAGVGPGLLTDVVGITKAYCTRVGAGPFPTELDDAVGDRLRAEGHEFGATTGRPRRCGWLDLPALRYAARLNGLTGLALTKLDVLSGLDAVRVAVAYQWRGRTWDELPAEPAAIGEVTPIYETLPGWAGALGEARSLAALPEAARRYVAFVEEAVGVPVILVSVGPGREALFELQDPFGRG